MRYWLAFLSILMAPVQAVAQPAPPPAKPWPREVQAVYDGLKADCRTEGGKFIPDRAGFATAVEVTNDGKPDWVLQYDAARCSTSGYSMWCGTAGCVISILGSGTSGLAEIYNDNVRGWDVVAIDPKRKGLMLYTHGSVCGGAGAEICGQKLVWDGRKWVQVGLQRDVSFDTVPHGETEEVAPPPMHSARWQFAGVGAGAIAAVTGHPEFAAIGMRCQPGGGLYMTVVPNKTLRLPAAGQALLLGLEGSTEGISATQTLMLEPGKRDFSAPLAAPTEALLVGRDSELTLYASVDGGDEWQEISYLSLAGSTAAVRSLEKQCASAAGAASTAQAGAAAPLAPLGIVPGYYVDEHYPCSDPAIEAIFYDGKRLGLMRGGGPNSEDANFVGPLGKVERSKGSFFLPEWEMEVKVLAPTRIQLTIQDTGPPMRWCPTAQIPANWRAR